MYTVGHIAKARSPATNSNHASSAFKIKKSKGKGQVLVGKGISTLVHHFKSEGSPTMNLKN